MSFRANRRKKINRLCLLFCLQKVLDGRNFQHRFLGAENKMKFEDDQIYSSSNDRNDRNDSSNTTKLFTDLDEIFFNVGNRSRIKIFVN